MPANKAAPKAVGSLLGGIRSVLPVTSAFIFNHKSFLQSAVKSENFHPKALSKTCIRLKDS